MQTVTVKPGELSHSVVFSLPKEASSEWSWRMVVKTEAEWCHRAIEDSNNIPAGWLYTFGRKTSYFRLPSAGTPWGAFHPKFSGVIEPCEPTTGGRGGDEVLPWDVNATGSFEYQVRPAEKVVCVGTAATFESFMLDDDNGAVPVASNWEVVTDQEYTSPNGTNVTSFVVTPLDPGRYDIIGRPSANTNTVATAVLTAVKVELQFEDPLDEVDPPPVVLFVNRIDADADGVPDYSDGQIVDVGIIKPLVLTVYQGDAILAWEDVHFTFEYDGAGSLPDFAGTPILHKGEDSGFVDYTGARSGEDVRIRIWNAASPTDERTAERYIRPGIAYNAASDLDFSGSRTFWVEGLNPGETTIRVRMSVSGYDGAGFECGASVEAVVHEPRLGLNTSNDHGDDKLRPGIPDVAFIIDEHDEMVKDQGEGFTWWWGRDTGREITRSGIVDLFPLAVDIPADLLERGMTPQISFLPVPGSPLLLGPVAIHLYKAVGGTDDRRSFVSDPEVAERQILEAAIPGLPSGRYGMPVGAAGGWTEFVAKVPGSGVWTFSAVLGMTDGGDLYIPVDSWRVTMKSAEHYWAFMSARGRRGLRDFPNYPTEDGRVVTSRQFSSPFPVAGHPGRPDEKKQKYLIWLHGFNVTQREAQQNYNEIFRRLFWLGYRGNFVGFTWEGDTGITPPGRLLRFDPDVRDAFYTAPSLVDYLRGLRNEVNAENVDIIAHSLGNLVMWEALRLEHNLQGAAPLVRNVASIQAAIWREAFEQQGAISYGLNHERYRAETSDDRIDYTDDQQMQHTWRFWFNSQWFDVNSVIEGGVFHSHVEDDIALEFAMRYNDWRHRGFWNIPRWLQYRRHLLEWRPSAYRAPVGLARLYNNVPGLMEQRTFRGIAFPYRYTDLNLPAGCVPNPLHEVHNYNALFDDTGNPRPWRKEAHSDYLVVDKEMWFPLIWGWWDNYLGAGGDFQAISTGKE